MNRPRIDHIGLMVADLDAAVERLRPVFGGDVSYKDLPQYELRTAIFQTANLAVELLQYTGEAAFARRVMGSRLGLNHVSAEVADAEASIAALEQRGFAVKDGFPTEGAHGTVAFFEPDNVTGLLFEICQPFAATDNTSDNKTDAAE